MANSINSLIHYKYVDRANKNSVDRALEEMFNLGQFDAKIVSNDGIIGAHRFVLSMFSKFFRELTQKVSNQDHIFTFVQYSPKIVKKVLELFYLGRTTVPVNDRVEIENLLKQLQVSGVRREHPQPPNHQAEIKNAGASQSNGHSLKPRQENEKNPMNGNSGSARISPASLSLVSKLSENPGQHSSVRPVIKTTDSNGAGQYGGPSLPASVTARPRKRAPSTGLEVNGGTNGAAVEAKIEPKEEFEQDGHVGLDHEDNISNFDAEDMDLDEECTRKQGF